MQVSKSVPISSILPDPANVRKHSKENIDTIKASLLRFGQQKPIVIDGNGIVRAGNGTFEAAKSLEWNFIDVVVSELDKSELTAYAIADNRSAELAEWDHEALDQQLAAMDEDLRNIAFDGFEIEDNTGTDPEKEWQGMPEYEQSDKQPEYQIKVNFLNKEDLFKFATLVQQKITIKTKSINYPIQKILSESAAVYE